MNKDRRIDQYSWILTKIYSLMLFFSKNTYAVDRFKEMIDTSKKVLEIGSGTGRDFKILKEHYNITGSDYSDAFLKTLRKKFKEIEFLKLNALTMDLADKFDVIYSNKVLHHLTPDQLERSFREQYKVLKEGGLLFHTMWKGSSKDGKMGNLPDIAYEKEDIAKIKGSLDIIDFIVYTELKEADSFIVILGKSSVRQV